MEGGMWIIVGVVLIVAALWFLFNQPQAAARTHYNAPLSVTAGDSEIQALGRWDERLITQHLRNLNDRPEVVPYYLEAVKNRFIVGQDTSTASARISFLKTTLEQLKAAVEVQKAIDDLDALVADREGHKRRRKEKEKKEREIDRWQQEQERLKAEKEKLALQLEIEKLKRQMQEVGQPAPPPARAPSPAEERREKREALEREIEDLRRRKREAAAKASTDEERIKIENAYDDEIDGKIGELRQYL